MPRHLPVTVESIAHDKEVLTDDTCMIGTGGRLGLNGLGNIYIRRARVGCRSWRGRWAQAPGPASALASEKDSVLEWVRV